jgi:hypothetical protein
MTYLYDPDGRRVAKLQNGAVVKQYYYGAAGHMIVEANTSGWLPGPSRGGIIPKVAVPYGGPPVRASASAVPTYWTQVQHVRSVLPHNRDGPEKPG